MDTGFGQSCRGYFLLKYLGYPRVKVLHGGLQGWLAHGYELTIEESTPMPAQFPCAEHAEPVLVNKYQMLEEMQQKQQGAVKVSSGEPVVRGSNISIREVATRHLMGDTIDQLKHRFPQLNPGQLFGALAYYYDHADEIDSLIAAKRAARAAASPATHVSSLADADMRPEG